MESTPNPTPDFRSKEPSIYESQGPISDPNLTTPGYGQGFQNPGRVRVETWLGSVFVVALAGFLLGFFFLEMKNFESDTITLNATQTQVVTISSTEHQLISQWIEDNNIPLPAGEGYNYIIKEYPDRPWIKDSSL